MSQRAKILAIDDEQVILDSIVKLCSIENWEVHPEINPLVGLKKLEHITFDLIVCDIMMPEMDGFEFLEKLNSSDNITPVIITTGFSTVENAVKSLYMGAIDFLPKPFSFDELVSNIKRGLKYARLLKHFHTSGYDSDTGNTSIIYIPCPPKYKRLGYATWLLLEDDGSVKIGITDLLLRTIEGIEKIYLNNIDDEIIQGNSCCQVESTDQLLHNMLAPISGRIIKRNEKVLDNHMIVEKDPYFEGWLYIIIPSDLDYESKNLVPCSSDRI